MDEILELYGGRNRIQPMNYDALAMLKNPLYVKMGETMKDTLSDGHQKFLAELQQINATQAIRTVCKRTEPGEEDVRGIVRTGGRAQTVGRKLQKGLGTAPPYTAVWPLMEGDYIREHLDGIIEQDTSVCAFARGLSFSKHIAQC